MVISKLIPKALTFLIGVALLVYSVEELIENITKTAVKTGVSAFFLTVLFAGMDFENWAFGVLSNIQNLPGIAVGSVIGSGFFLIGVALSVGCFITPFEVEVNKKYLFMLLLSPLFLAPTVVDGFVSFFEGFFLTSVFIFLLYLIFREEREGGKFFRKQEAEEVLEKSVEETVSTSIYKIIIFTVGIVAGSEMAVTGTKGVLTATGVEETVFGMTFVGLVMALEEILLVVEPVRHGKESIAVGNLIGSVLFFLTGNIGLIAMFGGLSLSMSILSFYLPMLMGMILLLSYFLYMGELKKKQGMVLILFYTVVWVVSYTL